MAKVTIICAGCSAFRYEFESETEKKDVTQKAGKCADCIQEELDRIRNHADNDVTQG